MELRRVERGAARLPFLPLLSLADDAADHVRAHLDEGELFVASEGGEDVAAVQTVPREHGAVELTLVAVAEAHQRRGVGKRMLGVVLDELAADGHARALVGTSNAGIGTIAFYQKAGFRLLAIERDHFDEARGYDGTEQENGIVHRDLVWFDQTLTARGRR